MVGGGDGSKDVGGLERIFSTKDVPFSNSIILPDGSRVTKTAIARTGPPIFGQDFLSIMAPDRGNKPVYKEKPEFTEEDLRKVIGGLGIDGLNLESLLDRLRQEKKEEKLKKCPFCYPAVEQKTPLEDSSGKRIYHEGLYTESGKPVISFPNISPFMPYHLLTVFTDHKTDLAELSYQDMINYFKSGRQIAQHYKSKGGKGIVDFMNWGDDAAASLEHPHGQRGMIIEGMEGFYKQGKLVELFQRLNGNGKFSMEKIMQIIRVDYAPLFVFENEHIFVYVPHSQTHPDETEVIFKNARNIFDFSDYDIEIAARSMLGVIHGLRTYRGVTDINLALLQADFNSENHGFRMRAVIEPRNKNKHGGIEICHTAYVIPGSPEITAQALRMHYGR